MAIGTPRDNFIFAGTSIILFVWHRWNIVGDVQMLLFFSLLLNVYFEGRHSTVDKGWFRFCESSSKSSLELCCTLSFRLYYLFLCLLIQIINEVD
jgi:hypothetical protein